MPFVDHFLAEPLADLPRRRPTSIRRTSHVDMTTHPDGTMELLGAAADPGRPRHLPGHRRRRSAGRELASLELAPDVPGSQSLIGQLVGRGFRATVDGICEPGTLESVLLSELPVAALLSGYASLYTGAFPSPIPDAVLEGFPVDICAGWAAPGSFMVEIRSTRGNADAQRTGLPRRQRPGHRSGDPMPDLAPRAPCGASA